MQKVTSLKIMSQASLAKQIKRSGVKINRETNRMTKKIKRRTIRKMKKRTKRIKKIRRNGKTKNLNKSNLMKYNSGDLSGHYSQISKTLLIMRLLMQMRKNLAKV